jgi:hypothetical protein
LVALKFQTNREGNSVYDILDVKIVFNSGIFLTKMKVKDISDKEKR